MLVHHQYYQQNTFHMMNIFVFMSEHFEFQTKFEFEFNWNVKEHETIMIRHMFSKKINLTPGVTVATLHRGVTKVQLQVVLLPKITAIRID